MLFLPSRLQLGVPRSVCTAGVWLQTSASVSKAGGAQTAPVVSHPLEPVQSSKRKTWGHGWGPQRASGIRAAFGQIEARPPPCLDLLIQGT